MTKRYMKNLFKSTLIIAFTCGAVSCTDLEEQIVDSYTQKITPANPGVGTKNNVNKPTPNDGLAGAFSRLLNGTAGHGGYFSLQEIPSDEAVVTQKGGDWFDGGELIVSHQHNFRSSGMIGLEGAWNDTFGGIFQCNDLLKNATLSVEKQAQLRMLRAYFYWRLLDLYGNVKIVTTPGVDVPQSNRLAVYNFVEAELLASIPNLPAGRGEYGRASQGAAHALLSRLYLNAKVYKGLGAFDNADLQKVIDHADLVINSGNYSLDPDFKKVFAPDNVDNMEHIMVAPFDEATGGGMNFPYMTLHYPSQLTFKLAQQPWNGYSTLEAFYNSFDNADKRKEASFIAGPQFAYNADPSIKTPILDLAFDKADPDGAPINYTPFINELFPNGSRQAGARLGKFSFKIGQNPDADNDFPILRLGEVILNKAEAQFRLGIGNPVTEIDKLRTRAGIGTIAPLTEGKLLAERGRELFQESLRRTDLIRFGAWGNAWWEKPAHNDPNKNLMPIPNAAIVATATTANKLTQNPGY